MQNKQIPSTITNLLELGETPEIDQNNVEDEIEKEKQRVLEILY